jgi:hypothetical protein
MKFKELLLREVMVSRTLDPVLCRFWAIFGSFFEEHWTPVFQFVWGSISVVCLGQRFSCLSWAAFFIIQGMPRCSRWIPIFGFVGASRG